MGLENGLEKLKRKIDEKKKTLELIDSAFEIMKMLSDVLPKLCEEQKKTNELLEKILEKIGGDK